MIAELTMFAMAGAGTPPPPPPPPRERGGDGPSTTPDAGWFVTLVIAAMVASVMAWLILTSGAAGNQLQPVPDRRFVSGAVQCPPKGITIDGRVVRVIDGDTVVVESTVSYHVRLLDCWAPESRTTDAAEKIRGLKAKARMAALATDKSVRIHLPSGGGDLTDMITLGRVLGRVWILQDEEPEPQDLSTIMVKEKLATKTKAGP